MFELLQLDNEKKLKFKYPEKIINVLKDQRNKEEISEKDYNFLYPIGSHPGI